MNSKAHIVGNGSSNELITQQYDYGFVVACNWPTHSFGYDAISMIDIKMIDYIFKNKIQIMKPVYCTEQVMNFVRQKKVPGDFQLKYIQQHRYSSAHQAVKLVSNCFDEIHLWGMDSMFSKDVNSQMDTMVTRKFRPVSLKDDWRKNWKDIFFKYSNKKYVIHANHIEEQFDYGPNTEIRS